MDVMELERNIKYVLGELEKDTYVQRVGDTYNYLTNEEQDIEQEIKNTDIDSTKEIDELKKILVSDVLGKMTVAYGEQRAQFRYGLRIDGGATVRAAAHLAERGHFDQCAGPCGRHSHGHGHARHHHFAVGYVRQDTVR